jgi:hypothetical protein
MTTTPRDNFEPDTVPVCEDCEKLAGPDERTRGTEQEFFSECGCEAGPLVGGVRVEFGSLEPVARIEFQVDYYDPRRGGVWTATFEAREPAERFAKPLRCYGRPAFVREVAA